MNKSAFFVIPKIGLEIHFQLNTITKLFSNVLNAPKDTPNTNVSKYDLGFSGILPVPSLESVILAIRACGILKAKIANILKFDRKHYFYFDLPHGYQITQIREPIGQKGHLSINVPSEKTKKITIEFIALEEDTAKTKYSGNNVLLDYNRHGVPLIEVVTAPEFTSIVEVKIFLKKLFALFFQAGVSTCSLADGTVRVDLNVSSSINDQTHLRTEIKNLNSLNNLEKAFVQEMAIQKEHLIQEQIPQTSETKRFSESTQKLIKMRKKFTPADYLFFPEFLIAPIKIEKKWINNGQFHGQSILAIHEEFLEEIASQPIIDQIFMIDHFMLQHLYTSLFKKFISFKTSILFFREFYLPHDVSSAWILKNISLIVKLLTVYESKVINFDFVKSNLLALLKNDNWNVLNEIKNKILEHPKQQITETAIINIIEQLCVADPSIKKRWIKNPEATARFLIGQILKKTNQKADPSSTKKIIYKIMVSPKDTI